MKLHEIAIFTDKFDSVADFYERLLNAKPSHRGERKAIFHVGGVEFLIHKRYDPREAAPPCENHTAFAVADLDRTVKDLERRGLKVEIPPRDYDWGRAAYLRDPDSHLIELYQSE
ncbi:MAG: VOC family protein [Planctomycetes bacterium]|nr:VOC family protein [Planctomycetota bacterium]